MWCVCVCRLAWMGSLGKKVGVMIRWCPMPGMVGRPYATEGGTLARDVAAMCLLGAETSYTG